MRGVVVLLLLGACGRFGFNTAGSDANPDEDAQTSGKPDGAPTIDADPSIDAAQGVGSYTITESVAAYASPAGAQIMPGFVAGADDENYPLALPFTFTFYGIAYTSLFASVNGFVTFGSPVSGAESYDNDCPINNSPPDATIAVFWDDLYFNPDALMGSISFAVDGASPDRRVTIEWRDLDAWYRAGAGNNYFNQNLRTTQKLTLHENGTIEIHYGPRSTPTDPNRDCGPQRHLGCSATVGLEAPGSTVTQMVQCGTAAGPLPGYQATAEGRRITFVPN
jgi:hypothetical protein